MASDHLKRLSRHFKALSRKNFILWYRQPCVSAMEVLLPVLLMIVLCVVRAKVPFTFVDEAGMLNKKMPSFPGTAYDHGEWSETDHTNYILAKHTRSLMVFTDYNGLFKGDHEPEEYDMSYDFTGPQFLSPTHCMRDFDYNHPRKSSPLIAVIGKRTNITNSITQYYSAISKVQYGSVAGRLLLPKYKPIYFNTTKEFEDYITAPNYKVKIGKEMKKGICMGIQDLTDPDEPNKYNYVIHYPDKSFKHSFGYSQGVPDQSLPVWSPYKSKPELLQYERYIHNGMAYNQNVIANQILINHSDRWRSLISTMYQPLPTETSVKDPFEIALATLMPLFMLLGYIPPVYNLTFKIVREKETRTKETMRIMGMTDLSYWLSWFVFYSLVNTVVTTLAWGMLLINVINYSQPMYLWMFFWLYGEAVFGQIIFLQSLFTGSKYAGIVSTIIYFMGVIVNRTVIGDDSNRAVKILASFLPQVSLMQGSSAFANYEATGVGLGSSTANIQNYGYSFNSALWMLFCSFLMFTLLGLYLDKVVPSPFGQRLHPCFCFQKSYYQKIQRRERRLSHSQQAQVASDGEALMNSEGENFDDDFERAQMPNDNYEQPPAMCLRMESTGDFLKVENLQKTYRGGFKAVRGVNVKMFDSQIFALLGHNGAGKTTVISMLTGLIEKSEGGAKCYETDMFDEMDQVREFMGVCPQHDVLFDLLTPREHLEIFYDFKGGDPANKKREIDALIQDVGLSIDQHKVTSTLSGGNKRKTSVCVALCGGSKLVMLDEPTAGMDLGARRNLWDMLKSYKKDRIIALTTHYMDEADVLGDRIGIMVQGQLKCVGSPLFLKNRFGLGYRITFVKKRRQAHPGLRKYLKSHFSGVQLATDTQEEIAFIIPRSQATNFGEFFDELDSKLEEFDIRSYGVSMSNLEDVFLKINKEYAPDLFSHTETVQAPAPALKKKSGQKKKQDMTHTLNSSVASRSSSISQQSDADAKSEHKALNEELEAIEATKENLIRGSSCTRSCTASGAKRFIIYKRDWCGLICQVIIPIILVLFGLWATSGPLKMSQSPPRPMSTGFYPYKQRIHINNQPFNMTGDGYDVMGSEFAKALPNATDAFDVTFLDGLNYTQFYDSVYKARNDGPAYPYSFGSYQIYQANKKSQLYQICMFLNVTSQDVAGLYPQYFYTALLRVATGDPDLEFNIVQKPYPIYNVFIEREEAAKAFDYTFMTAISLALIPCVMVQFILNERELKLKHQQLLSGMSLAGYWVSNLIFDIFMAYVPIVLIIALTFAFGKDYEGVWVLFILFPPAVVPFTYVTSFVYKSDVNAQIMTLFIHFSAGALGTAIVFALQQIPIAMVWGDALRWVFTIVPSFCVTHGILWAASGQLVVATRSVDESSDGVPIPRKLPAEIWDWYNLKGDCMILILHFFIGMSILMLIELEVHHLFDWCPRVSLRSSKSGQKVGPVLIKDDDVIAEEARVALQRTDADPSSESDDAEFPALPGRSNKTKIAKPMVLNEENHLDCIRVHNFQKIYEPGFSAPVMAVRQASFGLDYGECFALLGVNGAGKSTTFKSLTRETTPTTGEITVQGFDIQKQFQEARKLIGYCPQYDAIFPTLTVEETLQFYALVKGIQTNRIKEVVDRAIVELNLKAHRGKLAGTLSGGNKRKLSVAMAIIGNPPIILLDEPSAGMDPEARRFMWQVVEKISQKDKRSAVILTTHSMEEAEALSTKLGIMVRGGVFRCMGSSQHIKNKFGVGFEIEVKVKQFEYAELTQMAAQLGFHTNLQSKVNLLSSVVQIRDKFDVLILDQIRKDGLGATLVQEAAFERDGQMIRLRNLLEYLKAMQSGFKILTFMAQHFAKVELLEHCGEYFKLRVPKEGKTIGWLFGQLETEKGNLGIQEYSVSQTTLEQIFQNFANQSIASDKAAFTFRLEQDSLMLVNPDHAMTEDQEILSQRGLSFHASSLRSTSNPSHSLSQDWSQSRQ